MRKTLQILLGMQLYGMENGERKYLHVRQWYRELNPIFYSM